MMNKLAEEIVKPFIEELDHIEEDDKKIKKIVAIFPGRFQPFSIHHKKTYEWLKKKFGDAYITTSNKKELPKSPMNFKEKLRHMTKMGIPSSRIYREKVPYVANGLLKKFNPETTAVIYIFGKKDAGRLTGGTKKSGDKTYFQEYEPNKKNLEGYEKHGYIITAPHVSVKIAGKEVSGTVMRELLGHVKYDKNREKLFKQAFGYFDKGVFDMMHNKFKKIFGEQYITNGDIAEFLTTIDMREIIQENTATGDAPVDDGPPTFYKTFSDYKRSSKGWLNSMFEKTGWKVMQYILSDGAEDPEIDYTMSYNIVPAVAYGKTGDGKGYSNPTQKYKDRIRDVIDTLGWKIIDWMGTHGEGVGVEAPEPAGADAEAPNTDDILQKLGLTEEVELVLDEVERDVLLNSNQPVDNRMLLLCGGSFGHLQHPFDNKQLTFDDFKRLITLGLSGRLDVEGNVSEKCIYPEAELVLKNHGLMSIQEFVDGDVEDEVLAYNEKDNSQEFMQVIDKFNNGKSTEWLEIELEDGSRIQVTPNHRVFVKNVGYIKAENLSLSDELEVIE